MKHIIKLDKKEIELLNNTKDFLEELIYFTNEEVIPQISIISNTTGEIIEREELRLVSSIIETLAEDFKEFEQIYY